MLFINDLIMYHADTVPSLEREFIKSIDEYLDFCIAEGRIPNEPLDIV